MANESNNLKPFKPGQSGNPGGRPKLPEDVREARTFNKIECERVLNKFLTWPLEDLAAFVSDKKSPVLEALVARILLEGVKRGDHVRLEWVMQRLIGKVKEEIDLTTKGSLHFQVVNLINNIEKEVSNGEESSPKEIEEIKK